MNFRPDNDALKPIADRVNDVAFALYRELSDRGNLIFSPLGIYCVLRMLFEGARGETRQALSPLLREQPDTTAHAPLQALLAELESYTRPTDAEREYYERAAKARKEHEEFSRLGLDSIFSPGADLSGISEEPGFGVDEAFQDTYIAVDQHGTEATAATLPSLLGYIPPPRRINLTIDRPFLFAILDKKSGVILFLGKVEHPK